MADSVGKADFLSQPDKSGEACSKNKGGCGGDVSPFCHFYWVFSNIMDNVIAGFSSQSSQSQSVLKKTHQNKSIVFKTGGGASHFRLMLYIMSPL